MEVVAPVFDQYQQESPLNHLDLPPEQLPQTRADMKTLLDNRSRWLNAEGFEWARVSVGPLQQQADRRRM